MSRNTIVTVLVFALTYVGSFYFRIHVVDTPVGVDGGGVLFGAARQAMLWGQLSGAWGVGSLVAGLAALFFGGLGPVLAWSVLTAMALCNYNVDLGAIGFVLGFLRLVRFQRPARERSAV
ncbi:hypothetical protein SAMN04488503_1931 [Humidesulfovibrio mexicanus]|uniref:Uncharacterized protein n=1 Tax=Humidesulfovibrio mexicanus TaxID=147047 RepID=A0A239AAT8_9BACT|nr:hypothetical protein [Humidesulfovibrio mexicanus]SNR92168.1 hypothetical protein SAMN04488503_1931 [Humidesulfovibrio mexicanus]